MTLDENRARSGESARALFYDAPFSAQIKTVEISTLTVDDEAGPTVLIRTLFSGLSRGTERLVFAGRLPSSEWDRMRAPYQTGAFPFPVKYGYSAVGVAEAGPDALVGRTMFALHPHQTRFALPAHALLPVPEAVPPQRAILAANMETALNAIWDGEVHQGHRVVVIGAGVVGCLIAYLASRLAKADVSLIDIEPSRASIAEALGLRFSTPDEAQGEAQIVFHTSATESGLRCALELAAFEGRIVEVSWFGDKLVSLPLGGAFHSQRLQIVSSQVGHVAAPMRAHLTYRQRLEKALSLLDDPCLDVLITEEVAFDDLPAALPQLLAEDASGLATAICY